MRPNSLDVALQPARIRLMNTLSVDTYANVDSDDVVACCFPSQWRDIIEANVHGYTVQTVFIVKFH